MTREQIIAILKQHIWPNPSANVVCDVEGFEEAADAIISASEPQTAQVREALDSSQSLLAMLLHIGSDGHILSLDWDNEGLTKLLTDQIVKNRGVLAVTRSNGASPKPSKPDVG